MLLRKILKYWWKLEILENLGLQVFKTKTRNFTLRVEMIHEKRFSREIRTTKREQMPLWKKVRYFYATPTCYCTRNILPLSWSISRFPSLKLSRCLKRSLFFLYLSFLSCKDDPVEDICPKANYQSWKFSLDLFRFLRFLIGWLVWNSNADSKWQKCVQRRFATRTWEKKWKYHICYRFCMVIVFNYWNANLFRPIEKFLSLCSLCETLKKILHA